MSPKHIGLAGIALLVIIGIGYFLSSPEMHHKEPTLFISAEEVPEGARVITHTEEGFVPSELTLLKGEIVYFVTTTNSLFWPASDLHPSHLEYPEFDPMEPIPPGSAWSFTFDSVGKWDFHDHLAPMFTGLITVTE